LDFRAGAWTTGIPNIKKPAKDRQYPRFAMKRDGLIDFLSINGRGFFKMCFFKMMTQRAICRIMLVVYALHHFPVPIAESAYALQHV
jgi:hypothetical protein